MFKRKNNVIEYTQLQASLSCSTLIFLSGPKKTTGPLPMYCVIIQLIVKLLFFFYLFKNTFSSDTLGKYMF